VGIILLGVVLGSGLALGLAAFRESSDATVRTADDVSEISNLSLIGAIPTLLNVRERRRKRLVWSSVSGGYIVAIVCVAIAVVTAR
jgi:hypothetical protein